MTDIEKRWRNTGLLEAFGHGSKEAEILAGNLQRCVNFLLTKIPLIDVQHINDTLYLLLRDGDYETEYVAGFLLPIIVRLQMERNITTIDVKKLYYQFLSYRKSWKPLCPCCGMDEEAEMCSDFVKDF